ncbi:MAG: site-specific integrase [Candidatus Bathyarchaeota archaeon]|nr:site-specific integrase [Candidatus Bathyarchaeota archaeon]
MPQPWLVGKKRRTLNDVYFMRPNEIYELITSKTYPYKKNREFYEKRDRALMSLLYLTCGRVSEVLSLTKKQFDLQSEANFVIIRNMIVVKRKKKAKRKSRAIRDEVPLPKEGALAPFTKLVLEYLKLIKNPEDKLFNFGRNRAYKIVRYVTGQWPHWFRSQGESWFGKVFSNIFALKDYVGVVSAEVLSDYVKTDWREYRKALLGME